MVLPTVTPLRSGVGFRRPAARGCAPRRTGIAKEMTSTTARKVGTTARRARRNRALTWPARGGLAARALFYLLLASLVLRIAANAAGERPADPNGALAVIAAQPFGLFLLGA